MKAVPGMYDNSFVQPSPYVASLADVACLGASRAVGKVGYHGAEPCLQRVAHQR